MGSDDGYRVLEPSELPGELLDEFAAEVLEGLAERPKRLPCRFLYDDRGSRIFQDIMDLEEYYPTRCETEILESHGASIVGRFLDGPLNLVDLGAGDGAKSLLLVRQLQRMGAEFSFVPIDISESALAGLVASVRESMPEVTVEGIVAEYMLGLQWLAAHSEGRRNLVLFLGSNIGNFDRPQARTFLRRLWFALNPDDCVFIGFDLKKDIDALLRAYNDSRGVTAQFNLNLLDRINRDLGGDFDLTKFRHYSTYDVYSGAMESYLVSLAKQRVRIAALESEFSFDAWEPIHTEYSYKYLESDIARLAGDTGFEIESEFQDGERMFAGSLWRVRKELHGA